MINPLKNIRLATCTVAVYTLLLAFPVASRSEDKAVEKPFTLHNALDLPKEVILDATLRERYEFTDWFGPPTDASHSYSYGDTKAQLGVGYQTDSFKAYLQGQYSLAYGLPTNGVGIGANYYQQNDQSTSPGDPFIRQGYLKYSHSIEDINASGTVGRFLYSSGNEVPVEDKSLAWVQQKRVAERMIGPFDFTFGRSFDGARLDGGNKELGNLTASVFRPTEGGFYTDGTDEIQEITVVTTAYTAATAICDKPGQLQAFYYFYDDTRDGVVKVDNSPAEVTKANADPIRISTFGGHWMQLYDLGGMTGDTLLWGALQGGSWGSQSQFAASTVLEAGLRFDEVAWKPWIRGGWNWGSGDSDPNDDDHGTFFQMLPTVRIYAQSPFFNMMNTHDVFAQAILQPLEQVSLRTDVHSLFLSSDKDLFYSGSGATKSGTPFGYSGSSGGGNSYIGTLLDIGVTYNPYSFLALSAYYGHLFGGSVPDAIYDRNDLDYGFLELMVKI